MAATILISRPRNAARRAGVLHSQALRLVSLGRYRAAATAYRRALRLAESCYRSAPLVLPTILNDFGVLCKFMGRFAFAERMYHRALKLLSREAPGDKESLATLYHNLAGLDHARGHYGPALRLARQGLALRKSVRPCNRMARRSDEAALAAILADAGRTTEAAKVYRGVIRSYCRSAVLRTRSKGDPRHYEIAALRANLGALYARMGRLDMAERTLRHAVSVLETALGRNHPRLASALNNLAFVCARRRNFREAHAFYRRALRLLEMQSGRTYPSASVVGENYRKLRELQRVARMSKCPRH
jgi:tetratricopeptide (TPR) repeat protein